jgi:hypothetical protein
LRLRRAARGSGEHRRGAWRGLEAAGIWSESTASGVATLQRYLTLPEVQEVSDRADHIGLGRERLGSMFTKERLLVLTRSSLGILLN